MAKLKKPEPKEYSVKEFAALKNVTVSAVYKAIKEGRLESKKIGSHIVVIG